MAITITLFGQGCDGDALWNVSNHELFVYIHSNLFSYTLNYVQKYPIPSKVS